MCQKSETSLQFKVAQRIFIFGLGIVALIMALTEYCRLCKHITFLYQRNVGYKRAAFKNTSLQHLSLDLVAVEPERKMLLLDVWNIISIHTVTC